MRELKLIYPPLTPAFPLRERGLQQTYLTARLKRALKAKSPAGEGEALLDGAAAVLRPWPARR